MAKSYISTSCIRRRLSVFCCLRLPGKIPRLVASSLPPRPIPWSSPGSLTLRQWEGLGMKLGYFPSSTLVKDALAHVIVYREASPLLHVSIFARSVGRVGCPDCNPSLSASVSPCYEYRHLCRCCQWWRQNLALLEHTFPHIYWQSTWPSHQLAVASSLTHHGPMDNIAAVGYKCGLYIRNS